MGGVDYHHFAALVSTDDNFVDYESDEYTTFYPRSLICCRIVAITVSSLCMYCASYMELFNRARGTIFTFDSSPVHAVCASSDVAYNAANNLWCCWR